MLARTDIRAQMVSLCNLVTEPRYPAVLSQSCRLMCDVTGANLTVLVLLDSTSRNFVSAGGHLVGNANWALPMANIALSDSAAMSCPLTQVALTGQPVWTQNGAGAYDLAPLSALLQDVPKAAVIGFLPLKTEAGRLLGIYILAHGDDIRTPAASAEAQLILRAVGAVLELRKKEQIEARHRQALEQSLARADRDRDTLKNNARKRLKEHLPGSSKFMQDFRERLVSLADFKGHILIEGEGGLDKESIARELHKISRLSNTPFVYVNCCTLTPDTFAPELFGHKRGAIQGVAGARRGLLREAGEGTIYFDQVHKLHPSVQDLLLRLLTTRTYRPLGSEREIPATQRMIFSVSGAVGTGVDPADILPSLYHRIAQARLSVLPLRDRRDDIADIAIQRLEEESQALKRRLRFDPETLSHLMGLELSGNIRELEAMVQRACQNANTDGYLHVRDFTGEAAGEHGGENGVNLKRSLENFESAIIRKTLASHENNRALAAKALGIPKRTLADKCLKYEI